ncbi:hypothetical protein [Gymnodinialimonas ceratoperidinii]|uniref:Tyrosine specific protein phosphatases domain-containing protein n=1 Tax=Gymnodinialimonas ceratoperidinii TaxID=2856823 RepID=A0A8F6TVG5_9RHOB|nr:hypothetical protein [Gymnodinialimonas ceratoperidinii]QXT38431.1 hypothetical protein KYE46_10770 [Gymnodinialimonas ceratoperidinii]
MTGFPGLETSVDGSAVFTPEMCRETLEGLYAEGARGLVVLVERDELPEEGFTLLEATAAEVGLTLTYHPIVDYATPSEVLAHTWAAQRPTREALLRQGGTMAFSCQYGAGRSGLMACWTLMEGGLTADEAIAKVRQQFPDAVESAEQEAWLKACKT